MSASSGSATTSAGSPPSGMAALPAATRWLLWFQTFNAFNFTVGLGTPMLLTARFIGADEFQIGLLNGLPPLLAVLQLVATRMVESVGYRKALLAGWSSRSFMLLLIAPLPLLVGRVDSAWLVGTMIAAILMFNIIRGFASGAWLPWLTVMIPPERRGFFFGMEQRVMNASALATSLLCGWVLSGSPSPWHYGSLFIAAWVAGMASAWCLLQAPDSGPVVHAAGAGPRMGTWERARACWAWPPFRRTLRLISLWTFAISVVPGFLVLYLREDLALGDGVTLKVSAASSLGVFVTAVWWGRLSDRVGSRPLLRVSQVGQLGIIAFWLVCALGWSKPPLWGVFAIYTLWGVFTAAHAVGQARVMLACSPPGERTISMAFAQTIIALSAGTAPIFWGRILEWYRLGWETPGAASVGFSLLFGVALALGVGAQVMLSRVGEATDHHTGRVLIGLIYDWPIKILSSFSTNDGDDESDTEREP